MLAAVFTVSCKPAVSSNTPAETFAVTFVADEHGELKAEVDGKLIATNAKVEKGSTVTFTATPKNGYTVKNWTIEGGAFVTGTGTEGSLTAKVKITATTKVSVSFSRYKKVALNELDTYLQTASPTDIHYIEVTGLTAADLNGDWSTPSRLGKILKDNSGKKVALKLSVSGVTDMSYCFCDCTSLTKAPVIPIGVTQMTKCFCDCTSLTSAALQCMYSSGFMAAFSGCTSLAADSIKVPSDQLAAYKAHAADMGTQEDRFTDK